MSRRSGERFASVSRLAVFPGRGSHARSVSCKRAVETVNRLFLRRNTCSVMFSSEGRVTAKERKEVIGEVRYSSLCGICAYRRLVIRSSLYPGACRCHTRSPSIGGRGAEAWVGHQERCRYWGYLNGDPC